jgi:hypothetical protein
MAATPPGSANSKPCLCFKLKNTEDRCGWDCNSNSVKIPKSASPQQRLRLVRSLVGLDGVASYDKHTIEALCADAAIAHQRISIHHFSNKQLKIGQGGNMCLKIDAVADVKVIDMRNVNADFHLSTHALPPRITPDPNPITPARRASRLVHGASNPASAAAPTTQHVADESVDVVKLDTTDQTASALLESFRQSMGKELQRQRGNCDTIKIMYLQQMQTISDCLLAQDVQQQVFNHAQAEAIKGMQEAMKGEQEAIRGMQEAMKGEQEARDGQQQAEQTIKRFRLEMVTEHEAHKRASLAPQSCHAFLSCETVCSVPAYVASLRHWTGFHTADTFTAWLDLLDCQGVFSSIDPSWRNQYGVEKELVGVTQYFNVEHFPDQPLPGS